MLLRYATHPAKCWSGRQNPPRLFLAVALFLAGFMALAQPGLCPCWLMADVAANHPHPDGHPERPHSHDYLFEMFASGLAAPPPRAVIPARLFVAHLASQGLLRLTAIEGLAPAIGWQAALEPPPPRGISLLFN